MEHELGLGEVLLVVDAVVVDEELLELLVGVLLVGPVLAALHPLPLDRSGNTQAKYQLETKRNEHLL